MEEPDLLSFFESTYKAGAELAGAGPGSGRKRQSQSSRIRSQCHILQHPSARRSRKGRDPRKAIAKANLEKIRPLCHYGTDLLSFTLRRIFGFLRLPSEEVLLGSRPCGMSLMFVDRAGEPERRLVVVVVHS